MKKINFALMFEVILIFLFQVQIISSIASSNDYSVDSYHTGLAGGDNSNSESNSEFVLTYQQGSGNAENSNYSANIGIFPQPLFCGDGICNNGETCSTCSADCGCSSGYTCSSGVCTLITTPPPSGGVGGGAGCTYDWVCSEWYPEPCPSDGIQKRVCVNRGTCSGTNGMPTKNRTCIPKIVPPSEPLFDLFVNVPVKYKWITKEDAVGFDIKLVNIGNITTIDVFFKYWIADENGRLIAETQETRAIGEKDEFRIRILLPENLGEGIYKVYVQINYDSDKIAVAEDSFEIVKSQFVIFLRQITSFPYILIPVAILLLIILLIFIKRKKKHKQNKKIIKTFRDYKKRKRDLSEKYLDLTGKKPRFRQKF